MPDCCFIFAMGSDKHRRLREDIFQRIGVIHQHIAGRGAHKNLDAANAGSVCTLKTSSRLLLLAPI